MSDRPGPAWSGSEIVEVNFDGMVGPTHNYAGLSRGNLASEKHAGHAVASKAGGTAGAGEDEAADGTGRTAGGDTAAAAAEPAVAALAGVCWLGCRRGRAGRSRHAKAVGGNLQFVFHVGRECRHGFPGRRLRGWPDAPHTGELDHAVSPVD